MGMLIQLGIYAALIGGAWLAIHSFDLSRQEIGAKKQLEADTVVLEGVKKERDAFRDANLSLQRDVAKNAQETAACNTEVSKLLEAGKSAAALRAVALKAAEPKINRLSNQIAELETALIESRKKPEVTCEKALGKAGEVLVPLAAERLRDGSSAGAGGVGKAPGAATNPRTNPVRKAP